MGFLRSKRDWRIRWVVGEPNGVCAYTFRNGTVSQPRRRDRDGHLRHHIHYQTVLVLYCLQILPITTQFLMQIFQTTSMFGSRELYQLILGLYLLALFLQRRLKSAKWLAGIQFAIRTRMVSGLRIK